MVANLSNIHCFNCGVHKTWCQASILNIKITQLPLRISMQFQSLNSDRPTKPPCYTKLPDIGISLLYRNEGFNKLLRAWALRLHSFTEGKSNISPNILCRVPSLWWMFTTLWVVGGWMKDRYTHITVLIYIRMPHLGNKLDSRWRVWIVCRKLHQRLQQRWSGVVLMQLHDNHCFVFRSATWDWPLPKAMLHLPTFTMAYFS